MINQVLEKIVREEKERGSNLLYVRSLLKEYLQIYPLYFIYTAKKYQKNLIFTGGTCLYHFYNLGRLSEDLDFDYLKKFDAGNLVKDIKNFFVKTCQYQAIGISLKQKGRQILLKFPVLRRLGLAGPNESDLLHIKIDLSKNSSKHYKLITSTKSRYGFNFAARHYDLPDLMAGKIHAILERKRLIGKESKETIKGRDYYDLLWFVKKGVKPNLKRLSEMVGKSINLDQIEKKLDQKVKMAVTKFKTDFQNDLAPFVVNQAVVSGYVENYQEEYLRYKANSFSDMITPMVKCQKCGKKFSSGIAISKKSFENTLFGQNTHVCPFCDFKNVVGKKDYILF